MNELNNEFNNNDFAFSVIYERRRVGKTYLIDEYKGKSKLFLILCGSSMSFMEEQVLGYKSPLYGRRTSQYKIYTFNYLEASEFVEKYSYKDKSIVYGLTNGIAEYLTYFNDSKSLEENIVEIFLKVNGRLYE